MNLHDIDKIYEKGFESFKKPPPVALWNRLDSSLNAIATAYKKPVAAWLRNSLFVLIGAIIMSIIIYFSTIEKYFNIQSQNAITQNSIQNKQIKKTISKAITEKENNNSITGQKTNEKVNSKIQKLNNYKKEEIVEESYQNKVFKTQTNNQKNNLDRTFIAKAESKINVKTIFQETNNLGMIDSESNNKPNKEKNFSNLPYPSRVKANFPLLEIHETKLQLNKRNEYKLQASTGIKKNTHIKSLAVDLTIGVSQINNSFKSNENFETHTEYRKSNESRIITPTYNLNVKYSIDNLSLTTGLTYAKYGEKNNYQIENLLYDTIPYLHKIKDIIWKYVLVGYYQDPNNSDIWYPIVEAQPKDTIYSIWTERDTIIKTNNNYKNKNSYSYFEIPVLFGYSINHKRFNFELSSGVSFGFLTKSKGYIPSATNSEIVENSEDNLPLNKTSLNFLLFGGVSYNFSKRFSIILQPYYKKQLTSIFEDSYPIEQKYNSYGINGGIRFLIK